MKAIHLSRGLLSMTLGLATVAGAASAAKADSPAEPGDVPRSSLAPADYRIVKSMHAMSMVGISAGEIAQKNAGTQAVRDFGTTLVDTHTTGDQQLLAYAKKAGIDPNRMKNEPPPQELAYYLKSVDQMRTLHGAQFDQVFTATVRDAYKETIKQIQTALPVISDSRLKALLDQRLPILQKNYQTAAVLASQSERAAAERQPPPNTTSTGQTPQPAPGRTP